MNRVRQAALFALLGAGCASGAKRAPDVPAFDGGTITDSSQQIDSDDAADLSAPGDLLILGVRLPGGSRADIEVRAGRIVAVRSPGSAPTKAFPTSATLQARDLWATPSFIDSHVHLTYWPVGEQLVKAGVVAAVDLAAPESSLTRPPSLLRLLSAGPMITAVGGYPLDSWGSDGYGVACATAQEAIAAVDRLVDAGAAVIKLPVGQGPPLGEDVARAAITRAHERGRKVAVHALTDASAALAARLGADVLAHTPVEALSPATIEAWRGRAVISTLGAFRGTEITIANLRALRTAGVTVLYGTDLGNTRDPRIDVRELELLGRAGLSGADVVDVATAVPARFWGLADLGSLTRGHAASLLILDADPTVEPGTLTRPVHVIVDGQLLAR